MAIAPRIEWRRTPSYPPRRAGSCQARAGSPSAAFSSPLQRRYTGSGLRRQLTRQTVFPSIICVFGSMQVPACAPAAEVLPLVGGEEGAGRAVLVEVPVEVDLVSRRARPRRPGGRGASCRSRRRGREASPRARRTTRRPPGGARSRCRAAPDRARGGRPGRGRSPPRRCARTGRRERPSGWARRASALRPGRRGRARPRRPLDRGRARRAGLPSVARIAACCFRPASSSLAPAAPFLRDTARLAKARSSSSRAMRSGLARKSSLSGRSTVILRKPKCAGG